MRARVIVRARGPMGPHGAVWGAVGRYGGAISRGRSQRGLGGPGKGLNTEAGPILQEHDGRASQGLSGPLSSEQGRAVAIMHKKSPHPVRGRGQGARVAVAGAS